MTAEPLEWAPPPPPPQPMNVAMLCPALTPKVPTTVPPCPPAPVLAGLAPKLVLVLLPPPPPPPPTMVIEAEPPPVCDPMVVKYQVPHASDGRGGTHRS